jgi:homoserine kinase
MNKATAFAPATTGNVGVGFDVLGIALKTIGDTITVIKTAKKGIIEITKVSDFNLPLDPKKNTATVGLLQMMDDLELTMGFEVQIKKGIPLGSGMGGSAASAVAGVVAANALFKKPLSKQDLFKYALLGESAASGGLHGDNVAPCLFGGLILLCGSELQKIVSLPFPEQLVFVVVLPSQTVNTKDARNVLSPNVDLKNFVRQSANLSGFVAGCFKKDLELIRDSFEDIIVESQRAHLIKGFPQVKSAALKAGAFGCTISGAGPAVFAIAKKRFASKIKSEMIKAFEVAGAGPAQGWVSAINKKGSHLI